MRRRQPISQRASCPSSCPWTSSQRRPPRSSLASSPSCPSSRTCPWTSCPYARLLANSLSDLAAFTLASVSALIVNRRREAKNSVVVIYFEIMNESRRMLRIDNQQWCNDIGSRDWEEWYYLRCEFRKLGDQEILRWVVKNGSSRNFGAAILAQEIGASDAAI